MSVSRIIAEILPNSGSRPSSHLQPSAIDLKTQPGENSRPKRSCCSPPGARVPAASNAGDVGAGVQLVEGTWHVALQQRTGVREAERRSEESRLEVVVLAWNAGRTLPIPSSRCRATIFFCITH